MEGVLALKRLDVDVWMAVFKQMLLSFMISLFLPSPCRQLLFHFTPLHSASFLVR